MANLQRYFQKIFANNSNQVGVFGTGINKETSKDVETLQSADYEGGWSQAIVTNKNYPIWQERDGVDYGFSYQIKYLLQKGIPEWLSTETYYTNDYCRVGSTIFYSLQDNNINNNPTNSPTYWTELLTSNRSIGEIIPSMIPLTDAGLHLLDGSLISGTGIYSSFVTYMVNLSATVPNIFTTEVDWQNDVSQYGVCGKFVYDSVNNTIRLPKITGMIEGTIDSTKLGDLVEAGLPNLVGSFSIDNNHWIDGALFRSVNSRNSGATGDDGLEYHCSYDASRYNSIYGNSTTVQPQAIKVFYYIVIATSTKTEIEVDIDDVVSDLNGKADVDLTNVNNSGTSLGAGWAMPSSTYDDLTLGASGSTYTAPANGWVQFSRKITNGNIWVAIVESDEDTLGANDHNSTNNAVVLNCFLPVRKNCTFKVGYNGTSSSDDANRLQFIYAVGSESEVS